MVEGSRGVGVEGLRDDGFRVRLGLKAARA